MLLGHYFNVTTLNYKQSYIHLCYENILDMWKKLISLKFSRKSRHWTKLPIPVLMYKIQYIPRNMHTVFALLCFVVVIHWLISPYPSGLLHWHCGNLTIAPVPAKQPWWIWINTSCGFIMNDCITTTKQSTANRVHISWDILYVHSSQELECCQQ